MNYYNENDPYAAQFLRNLIAAGLIAPGWVDERPIQEVEPFELIGYIQCHFFAGCGIWPLALRAAGWPDDEPIWTGSCPCQPFSAAGIQKGFDDARHLWPYWQNLIAVCRPSRIAGEQVAAALEWLDLVSRDLEASGYAFGAADLCAAGFGGAHIRQRNYFVGLADSDDAGLERRHERGDGADQRAVGPGGMACGLDDSKRDRRRTGRRNDGGNIGILANAASPAHRLEYANLPGQHGRPPSGQQSLCVVSDGRHQSPAVRYPRKARSLDNVDWLLCRNPDGEPSWRPVEPGTFPLANGVASRMGKLRSYGNALDAETATEFCEVLVEICGIRPVNFAEYDL